MTLNTGDCQSAAERPPSAILDDVTNGVPAGGFTNQAPVDLYAPFHQCLNAPYCTVYGGTFFVTGEQ